MSRENTITKVTPRSQLLYVSFYCMVDLSRDVSVTQYN